MMLAWQWSDAIAISGIHECHDQPQSCYTPALLHLLVDSIRDNGELSFGAIRLMFVFELQSRGEHQSSLSHQSCRFCKRAIVITCSIKVHSGCAAALRPSTENMFTHAREPRFRPAADLDTTVASTRKKRQCKNRVG